MRVAVVDIGSNSTRLLIADVDETSLTELDRRSVVTRLGEGLEATGGLGEEPQQRVFAVLEDYAAAIEAAGCEARAAVMTSAVRDAANGQVFAAAVHERHGLAGRTLSGDEEARLTFLGATTARNPADEDDLLVVDIGGGSTELVAGARGEMTVHASTQVGVVRHTERHIHSDPPADDELDALAADAAPVLAGALPAEVRDRVGAAIAVAGTATSVAAIDLGLEPYDAARVEGHVVGLDALQAQLDRLAAIPLEQRRDVPGLHPDRAPTIIAGIVILIETLKAFDLQEFEASERDILWGVAREFVYSPGRVFD